MEIKDMLEGEIERDFDALAELKLGTQEHSVAVEKLTKLYELKLEEDKAMRAQEEASVKGRSELWHKVADGTLQVLKIGVDLTGIILPLVVYGAWMRQGYEHEKTGIVSSPTFKNFIKFTKPKK